MKKLDTALKLEQIVMTLREKRELIELDMQNITEELHKGKFMNTLLSKDLHSLLGQVDSLQAEAYALAAELNWERTEDDSLDKLETALHGIKEELEQKAALEPIVAFIRNLHSKNEEVQQILQGLRQEVATIDFDALSVAELQEALHKYSLLEEAFAMKDSFQRFQKVMAEEMSGLFDLRLLYQLTQMNDLYLTNDPLYVDAVQEELDFEEKKTEILAAPVTEAATVAVEEEKVEAAVEENVTTDEASTEAVSPVEEAVAERSPENPLLYYGPNEPIYTQEDWLKQKRFSANSFKREVPDAMSAMVFQFIGEYFFFSFKSLQAVWGLDESKKKYVVDRFVRAGYLKECKLADEQVFYALTKYGFNIYQAQSLKNFLHMRDLGMSGFEKQYGKVRKYTAWAYLDTLNVWSKLEKNYKILNTQSVVNAESFIYSTDIASLEKSWKIAGVGIFTEDLEKFNNVLTYLNQHTYDIIVVSGATREQAKAMISWLREHLEASTRARSFMYKVVNEDQFYAGDDRPVAIEELANHVCLKPNCPLNA